MGSVGVTEQPDRRHQHEHHKNAHGTSEHSEHPRNGSFRQPTGSEMTRRNVSYALGCVSSMRLPNGSAVLSARSVLLPGSPRDANAPDGRARRDPPCEPVLESG